MSHKGFQQILQVLVVLEGQLDRLLSAGLVDLDLAAQASPGLVLQILHVDASLHSGVVLGYLGDLLGYRVVLAYQSLHLADRKLSFHRHFGQR